MTYVCLRVLFLLKKKDEQATVSYSELFLESVMALHQQVKPGGWAAATRPQLDTMFKTKDLIIDSI